MDIRELAIQIKNLQANKETLRRIQDSLVKDSPVLRSSLTPVLVEFDKEIGEKQGQFLELIIAELTEIKKSKFYVRASRVDYLITTEDLIEIVLERS